MNQFRRFMYGRYGLDQLGRALIVITLLFSLVGSFTRLIPLYLISYLFLGYALFRILSKNIQKRSGENLMYYKISHSFINKVKQTKQDLFGTKTHKYYHCPQCRQTIRVPRGKGKICITCPKCKREFIKRT